MSRQDEIFEAGQYLGLSAGHFAAWGTKWRETGHYGDKFFETLENITLNDNEIETLRETSLKRSAAYLAKSAREGKLETAELSGYIEIARAEIESRIAALVDLRKRK